MTATEIKTGLNEVFRSVFDDESIVIQEVTTAKDIEGWDSLNHINLIVAAEKRFKVKFTTREVNGLKDVGELIALIQRKLS